MTSKKSSRIVKWKVGVNIFLLERHLFPVLEIQYMVTNKGKQHSKQSIIWPSQHNSPEITSSTDYLMLWSE